MKYFSVKIEQLMCKSRSGPLTFLRKKWSIGLEIVEKHWSTQIFVYIFLLLHYQRKAMKDYVIGI